MKNMFEILVTTIWACFVTYTLWFFTSAKDYVPLTVKEAKMLWKIHKQFDLCNAKTWQRIMHNGKIVGFKCECGYTYVQKRPIIINSPATVRIHETD